MNQSLNNEHDWDFASDISDVRKVLDWLEEFNKRSAAFAKKWKGVDTPLLRPGGDPRALVANFEFMSPIFKSVNTLGLHEFKENMNECVAFEID